MVTSTHTPSPRLLFLATQPRSQVIRTMASQWPTLLLLFLQPRHLLLQSLRSQVFLILATLQVLLQSLELQLCPWVVLVLLWEGRTA